LRKRVHRSRYNKNAEPPGSAFPVWLSRATHTHDEAMAARWGAMVMVVVIML
jgi:hypothetical protein